MSEKLLENEREFPMGLKLFKRPKKNPNSVFFIRLTSVYDFDLISYHG